MTKLGKNLKLNEQSDKQYSKELIQTQNTHIYIALSWVFNFQCFTWEKDLFFHKLMIWEIKSLFFLTAWARAITVFEDDLFAVW